MLSLSVACGGGPSTSAPPGGGPDLPSSTPVGTPADTSSPPLPDGGGTPGNSLPSGAKPVPSSKLDRTALPEGYPATVWTEGDGSRVGVVAQEGGCSKASVEVTEQKPERVVLTLVESNPAKPQMCTMDLRYPSFTVTLNAPLAERPLVLKHEQRTY